MAYVIAEPCIDVKDKAYVEVCPVDCIYEGPNNDSTYGLAAGIFRDSLETSTWGTQTRPGRSWPRSSASWPRARC